MRRIALALPLLAACARLPAPIRTLPEIVSHGERLVPTWVGRADPIEYPLRWPDVEPVPLRKYAPAYAQPGTLPFLTDHGLVLALDGNTLVARDLSDGRRVWESPLPELRADRSHLQAAQAGDVIFVCAPVALGLVGLRLREADGAALGPPVPLPPASILLAGHGRVYVHTTTELRAVDPVAGTTAWEWSFPPDAVPVALALHRSNLILRVDAAGPYLFLEYFQAERGYPLTACLDPNDGELRWDAVGRLAGQDAHRAYLVREERENAWERDLETGEYRGRHLVHGFDGAAMWVHAGGLLFTARSMYFPGDVTVVGGAVPARAEPREERELVRYDFGDRRVAWRQPYHHDARRLRLFLVGSTVIEAEAGFDTPRLDALRRWRAPMTTRLRAWNAADGTPLWDVAMPDGIVSFAVGLRQVVLVLPNGELRAYDRR